MMIFLCGTHFMDFRDIKAEPQIKRNKSKLQTLCTMIDPKKRSLYFAIDESLHSRKLKSPVSKTLEWTTVLFFSISKYDSIFIIHALMFKHNYYVFIGEISKVMKAY